MSGSCYLCNNKTEIKYKYPNTKAGSFNMMECSSCGLLRIDPIPDRDLINSLYTVNNLSPERLEHEVFSSPLLTYLKKKIIIKPLLNKLRAKLNDTQNPSLLDIGCSTGWITSNSREAGFDAVGLEANAETAKYGSERYGIEILPGFIEDLDLDKKFNAVTMFHILEHLTDPLLTLNKVHSHLLNNGKLLMVIPNAESLGVDIFGHHYNWNIPDHISFFSPDSAGVLLKNSGFRMLDVSHLTSPPMLIYSYNRYMAYRKKNHKPSLRITNPIFSNALMLPVAVTGKILRRGEVIAVYAEKI